MKKKIIIITAILLAAGALAFAYETLTLSPDQAAEQAVENSRRVEIDNLMMRLNQITYENSVQDAKITPVNTYYGQIAKYVTPIERETTYLVSKMTNERVQKQTELDVLTAAVSLYNNQLTVEDARVAYETARENYKTAIADKTTSRTGLLNLEYAAESKRISLKQAESNLAAARRRLDDLTGVEGIMVSIPEEYDDPYDIDPARVIESKLDTDINFYRLKREMTAAQKRFEIAGRFFDEEDETYIRDLAGLKTAELNLDSAGREIEVSVYDDIDALKTKYDSIELEKLNNRIKKESYDSALRQYNAGIISLSSFESYEHSYDSAKRQLKAKIYDFVTASLRFEIETGFSF